jgi:hypothetical protein
LLGDWISVVLDQCHGRLLSTCLPARDQAHAHAILHTQGDQRVGNNGGIGHELKTVALSDRCQQQLAFQRSKRVADADMGAAAERKVGILGQHRFARRRKATGIVACGIGEVLFQPVHHIG